MAEWLVRQSGNPPIGPVSTELVIRGIEAGKVALTAEVCKVGTRDWMPIDMVDEFSRVTYDEDAATRVTESPWFMEQSSSHSRSQSQSRKLPPPPAMRPQQISSLGLSPPPAPPARSGPRVVPPARSVPVAAPPPPAALPLPLRKPADNRYDVDDNALTRVADTAEPGAETYEFDDETMTRVAAPRTPAEPIGAVPKNRGLLKTAPMWPMGGAPIEPVRPAAGAPARPNLPPAAPVARTEDAIQVRADLVPNEPRFPPPGPGFGAGSPQAYQAPQFGPTLPSAAPPPVNYAQPPPAHYQRAPLPVGPRGDGGVKALIGLIILLFVALMVVLILLVLRR